jgi:cytochrome c oxidase assembly protein subunit 15
MSEKFIKYYKLLCIMTFLLIPLGGSVRAMNAGLACPDWPLCFGDVIPDYHPEVYFEFIHRVWAGVVGLISVTLNILVIRNSVVTKKVKWVACLAILLLLAQVVMGGLTVTLQLKENIVATHLALGTGFFAVLVWIYQNIKSNDVIVESGNSLLQPFASLTALTIYMQILLGGFVASNYAALVCLDFPTCHGQLIPTFKGIIGLQVIHRLGAYTLTFIIVCFSILLIKTSTDKVLKNWAWWLIALLVIQVCIGILNVLLLTPPIVTVLHLATATALLGVAVSITQRLWANTSI